VFPFLILNKLENTIMTNNFQIISKRNAQRLAEAFASGNELSCFYKHEVELYDDEGNSSWSWSWRNEPLNEANYYSMASAKAEDFDESKQETPENWCFFPHFEEAVMALQKKGYRGLFAEGYTSAQADRLMAFGRETKAAA
jgi:hypothetical protein